jgi:outer membrane protein assembly factor BamB
LTQWSRRLGAALGLLLLSAVFSACGGTPVAQTWPGLTLADDTIYAISGTPQQVYLLDAESGTAAGTFVPEGDFKGTRWWSPVAVGGGLAFVGFAESGTRTAGLYAFDPEAVRERWPGEGHEIWQVPADNFIIPAPTYADGVVYFGDSAGLVYAVDVESKRVKPGWPFQAEEAIWASPLVIDGRVYVAAQDHYLYCLDAETGDEIWKTKLGAAMAAQPELIPTSGILYQGAFDGKVYAIQADSGKVVEGFDFQAGNWVWSKPLVDGDLLYVTSLDGKLYALNPADGTQIWSYCAGEAKEDDCEAVIRTSPVPTGDFVIVATEAGRVIAVKDAQSQWDWPGGTPQADVLTTPVVGEGSKVYVILMNGDVQALDVETGAPQWSFSSPESE